MLHHPTPPRLCTPSFDASPPFIPRNRRSCCTRWVSNPSADPHTRIPKAPCNSALTSRDLRFLAHLVRCDPSKLGVGEHRPAEWLLYRDEWIIACTECVRADIAAGVVPFERALWRRATCTLCLRHRMPLIQIRDLAQDLIDIDPMHPSLNQLEQRVLPVLLTFESDLAKAIRGIAPPMLDDSLSPSAFLKVIGDLATFAVEAWTSGGCSTVNAVSQHSTMLSKCPTLFHSRLGTRRYARNATAHMGLAEIADPATRRAALWLVLQVLHSPPTSRPAHPLQLGRSVHDDFLGSFRHDGHDWLADQAQAWPEAYRTRYWPEFTEPSDRFKGTSDTFRGPQ